MKKLMFMALCAASVLSMSAQKANVDQANKLAGKTEKISEARELIKQAMQDPTTAKDARTYYTAGKIEWDAYDKARLAQQLNPNDSKLNPAEMGNELLSGYQYFLMALPYDSLPNEKGQVKPKYSKDIIGKIAGHAPEFFNAGASLYNADKKYPEAYRAFMIYGDLPELAVLGNKKPQIPDSVRATSYFNAGLCAWSANELRDAAKAFRKARIAGYSTDEPYIYEIASWQNLSQKDTTLIIEAKSNIMDAARAGYERFGISKPLFINNMVNAMITDNEMDKATNLMNELIAAHPDNANLYGLRGFVYDRTGNDEASMADYLKAASLPDCDYETLKNAAKKVFRVGTEKWNAMDQKERVAQKDAIKATYFQKAKDLADLASQKGSDADLDYVLENVNYALETYFK